MQCKVGEFYLCVSCCDILASWHFFSWRVCLANFLGNLYFISKCFILYGLRLKTPKIKSNKIYKNTL